MSHDPTWPPSTAVFVNVYFIRSGIQTNFIRLKSAFDVRTKLRFVFRRSAMFCSVTFIVFLFGVFGDATWGEELSDENVRDETLAKHWLQEFNYKFLNVFNYDRLDGQYNYSIDETEKNRNLSVNLRFYQKDVAANVILF